MADNKSHLPLEITEIILSKLSVKPLLRFKTVSKSWNVMISDPVFVENHIRRRSKYSENLFLCCTSLISSIGFSLVKLENKNFQTLQKIEAPFGCWLLLCFCEGVLLLTNYGYKRLVLWNPSTRTSRKLYYRYECENTAIGLCHDPNTGDFKVVIAARHYYSVYSCKKESWSMKNEYEIEDTGLGLMRVETGGVCVDGASYWVSSNNGIDEIMYYEIMYYDPRDDKFKMLQKPENVEEGESIHLVNMRGSLCMYCYFHGPHTITVRIWTKENGIANNSWKELVTVKYKKMSTSSLSLWQPLCFLENKIVFVVEYETLRLVIYNPSEKQFEKCELDIELRGLGLDPVPYMESL